MQTQEELAPHVDEITRALDNRVDREQVEDELKKYLEYGVDLSQAKRDIVRNHGGGALGGGDRSLEALTPGESGVDLKARVLTVNPKDITVKGEPKRIWYGFLADKTGRVPYTAWKDHGLQAGASYEIKNVYVKEGYRGEGVEVNIGDYANVDALEEDVPVAEGAAAAPASGGAKTVEDLTAGDSGVDLTVRVLTVNPKDITVKGEPKRIWYGFLADETGRAPYTAWKDHGLEAGQSAEVKNVYVKEGYRGEGVEVNIGDYATVEALDDEVPVAEGAAAAAGGDPVERTVKELTDGIGNVTVTARVLELDDKTVNSQGEEKRILVGELGDETGKVPFTAWHEFTMEQGQVVRVTNGYVKSFRNVPNLNFGEDATVDVLPDDALPPAGELARDTAFTIGELEASGGATGVVVEGVLLEVKKGSGLIFRCPECNRVLQKRECRVHGKVDGNPDLRVKAVLDDGTGALTTIMLRDVTEDVLGKTLDDYQEMAREAMTQEVVMDEFVDTLTARTVRVHGNVTSDDFGLMLIATGVEFAKLEDVSEAAERLLYEIEEAV